MWKDIFAQPDDDVIRLFNRRELYGDYENVPERMRSYVGPVLAGDVVGDNIYVRGEEVGAFLIYYAGNIQLSAMTPTGDVITTVGTSGRSSRGEDRNCNELAGFARELFDHWGLDCVVE